jgi:glycosyltransferase involved in cell wall biosynthesis
MRLKQPNGKCLQGAADAKRRVRRRTFVLQVPDNKAGAVHCQRLPKVSIIMSVYNGEKYLREAIDSILRQTFNKYEFIIINDGSTDKTKNILEEYSDSRIRLYHHENIGLTRSLNKGLKIAKGRYIARQDADDISLPERLSHQVKYLDENHDIGLVGSHVAFIDKMGREINIWKTPVNNNEIKRTFRKRNSFCHGAVMFRKECMKKVGSYREKILYAQDYDYWVRISEHYKTANLDKILYKNRRTSASISRNKLSKQLNFHLLIQQLMKEREKKGYDSLELIDTGNVLNELKKKYGITNTEVKKFKSNHFLRKFSESIESHDLTDALDLWLKSLVLEPKKWKIRLLFEKLNHYVQMAK